MYLTIKENLVFAGMSIRAFALSLALVAASGTSSAAAPAPFWIQDGTANAKVFWVTDGSVSEDNQTYSSPLTQSDAVVIMADAHASSYDDAAWADMFAVGTVGSHAAWASARANTTLYGLTPGDYRVSFVYMVGPSANGLTSTNAEVGYEHSGGKLAITGRAGDSYSSVLHLDQWISFYAIAAGNSPIGTAQANAGIFSISVTPVPEPDIAWLFGAGGAFVALVRQRAKTRAGLAKD